MMQLSLALLSIILAIGILYLCYTVGSVKSGLSSVVSGNQKQIVRKPLIADYDVSLVRIDSNKNNDAKPQNEKKETNNNNNNKPEIFIQNIQGSISSPTLRYDLGLLKHTHISTKPIDTIANCNLQSNLIKHRIPSSASNLHWKNEREYNWEIVNDRGNQTDKKNMYQYIIITDYNSDDDTIKQTIKMDESVVVQLSEEEESENDILTKGRWMAQDERLVIYNNTRIIVYHSKVKRCMYLYDDYTKQTVMLTICGHGLVIEKNWIPIVISNDILLFMYSIDPLAILSYNVKVGNGVCKLIFGHLPLTDGMDAPYGGTPFVELTFHDDNEDNHKQTHERVDEDNNNIDHRSFLSIAHSRKGNDLISEDRKNNQRIYRPVPVILHMFCINDSLLSDCTFTIDVYDLWHEVEGPKELVSTPWKTSSRTRMRMRSISFPYDLHIFQKENIIRIGIEFEDCYSSYEDYEVDFDSIRKRMESHPMRVVLAEEIGNNKREDTNLASPKLVTLDPSFTCPATYSHAGFEEKVHVSQMASKDDLVAAVHDEVWIVSHQYPNRRKRGNERKFERELTNYPSPLQKIVDKSNESYVHAPKICIYAYGAVYQSILSELNDYGKLDTARVLHNNKNFPAFSSIEELLSYPDDDPTGIRYQFENFIRAENLVYPVILIRDDIFHHTEAVKELERLVNQLLDEEEYDILSILNEMGYDDKPKSHSLESIEDSELKSQFIRRFEDIHDMFESQPLIRLLKPDSNTDTGLVQGSR